MRLGRYHFVIIHYPPNRLPIPNAAPADIAPIKMVQAAEQYQEALVTKLLPKPSTNKKKTEIETVAIVYLSSNLKSLAEAIRKGIKGMRPKMQKLKNVTILFLKGFYSSGIRWSSSIIITLKKPSLFLLRISTIS